MNNIKSKFALDRNTKDRFILLTAFLAFFLLVSWMMLGFYFALALTVCMAVFLYVYNDKTASWTIDLYQAKKIMQNEATEIYKFVKTLSRRAKLDQEPLVYYIPSYIDMIFTVKTKNNYIISISDGLIRNHSYSELAGLIAHEVAHIKNDDIKLFNQSDMLSRVAYYISWCGFAFILINLLVALLFSVSFNLLFIVMMFSGKFVNATSWLIRRDRENQADLSAVKYLKDESPLLSAMTKTNKDSFSKLKLFLLPSICIHEPSSLRLHPTYSERVNFLKNNKSPQMNIYQWEKRSSLTSTLAYAFLKNDIQKPKRRLSGVWY